MMRMILTAVALVLPIVPLSAQEKVAATLFRNPACGCCEAYADYLRANGFEVNVIDNRNMTLIRRRLGVPENLEACHTTVVGGYVVEGHVPLSALRRLLAEKPAIKGISLPGMPAGSPGMSGAKEAPFEVLSLTGELGPAPVFARD